MDIANTALLRTCAFIDGSWVTSSNDFPVTNPATGHVISHISDIDRDGAAHAISAANVAMRGWQAQTAKQRSYVLRRLFDLIIENTDDLARIITAEMGKPVNEAKAEVAAGAAYFEWFAEEAKRVYGDVIPGHLPGTRNLVIKQPIGVVAAITPWNFPFSMLARKIAPAFAVGCCVVSRPSELAPQTALALAVLAQQAGIPAGVFNVITSKDAASIGQEFCENPIVAKLTFTGSTRVGRILMAQAAPTIKKLSLELGGNAPFIVFDDGNLDAAVDGALASKFRNNGQTCVCANRLYVQSGIYDAFIEKLAAKVRQLKIGDGTDATVDIGPLVSVQAMVKVIEHIADATSKGATLICGGKPHALGGNFIEPCVMAHATAGMLVAREETFGPLAPVFKFEDEQEVIAAANDTEFGLAAHLFATDVNLIWRVSEKLETGMVGINTGMISTEVSPFGGVKQSGIGREGSKYGLDDYLEIKSLCFGDV